MTPIPLDAFNENDEALVASGYDTTINYFDRNSYIAKAIALTILVFTLVFVPTYVVRELNKFHKEHKLESKECIIKYSYFYSEYKSS